MTCPTLLCCTQGFQQQTRHWPQQPLDAAVAWVSRLPRAAVVADFGCGHAQLAARVPQQVLSLDLVAAAPHVLACDMAHTPLGEQRWLIALACSGKAQLPYAGTQCVGRPAMRTPGPAGFRVPALRRIARARLLTTCAGAKPSRSSDCISCIAPCTSTHSR